MTAKHLADLILTHGYLVTVDQQRRIIRDGAVAVKDGAIVAVGKTDDVLALYAGKQHDCHGGVVHPGLVDTHEHLALHITRGWEPDTFSVLDTWLNFECIAFPAETEVEEAASAEIATAEMIKNGITMFSDTGSAFFPGTVIESASKVGIRGFVGSSCGDAFNEELAFLSKDTDRLLADMEANLLRYPSGRVHASPQVCGMGDASDALVIGAKELARKYNQVLFMHQCVYQDEVDAYRAKYGYGPIRHLEECGVLDENTTLVHMVHLDDGDVDILKRYKVNVVHCPAASIKFGLGAFSRGMFPEMHDAGINIALGSDSGTWSDAIDILHQVYLAATVHREIHCERTSINSYSAFEMATIGGARAVGLGDQLGSLEVGKRADIVVHHTNCPEAKPTVDPFMNLVFATRSKTVDTVLVDGEVVLLHGKLTRIDEDAVYEHAQKVAFDFKKKIGFEVYSPWEIL